MRAKTKEAGLYTAGRSQATAPNYAKNAQHARVGPASIRYHSAHQFGGFARVLVLGIETSCDETGVALYDSDRGLLGHTLHSQAAMHEEYGGVVPELASRDHVRRVLPLTELLLKRCGRSIHDLDAVAYTRGPGLAGALLVGAAVANGLAFALGRPVIGVHHLEGHLLSPLLANPKPNFPFIALLVSGGHSQIMRVSGVGAYETLGDTLDDAAGEAFDKSAKLLGLGYPGGPALAKLASGGDEHRFALPRPLINSGDLDFSFSGLKTAVRTLIEKQGHDEQVRGGDAAQHQTRSDIAAAVQAAIVDVLVAKSVAAVQMTGVRELVVAGGVGANQRLREMLRQQAQRNDFRVYYPPLEFCTDNGAMIALAGALRLGASGEFQDTAGSLRLSASCAGENGPLAGALRLSTKREGETHSPAGALGLSARGEFQNTAGALQSTPSADQPASIEAPYSFTVAPRWDLASLTPVAP
jgi:N6-L-threonylcarbamoyladenine synthase